jgi:hypothetical protein
VVEHTLSKVLKPGLLDILSISSISNEIFSAEKSLKLKYSRFETRTFGFY